MIIGALLARNEADRYLERALKNAAKFCDKLVILDDGSSDSTPVIAARYGGVYDSAVLSEEGYWGSDETLVRAQLWKLASDTADSSDWIYHFDADHELIEITPEDFRVLCSADQINTWAFPLYDCWGDDLTMRTDGHWRAHLHPRVWLSRACPSPDYSPDWGSHKRIHAGHLPKNYPFRTADAPQGAIRHLGYIKAADRELKHSKYLACDISSA